MNQVSNPILSWREKIHCIEHEYWTWYKIEIMLVHLDEVHEPVHDALPVAGPTVLEVDQRGVNIITSGSENQTLI